MGTWIPADAVTVTTPEEIELSTRRIDGSLRNPRIIWIVPAGDRVFIRSTNGRDASWFRWAIDTGHGRITASGKNFDVAFTEADDADLDAVDAAYRTKYGRYASIVDHLAESGPRAATLEVTPT